VTSEGLATFLQDHLHLKHVRYLKGYANVINKAKELTESGAMNAELAIETSGHCAMQENDFLDDGTYTAVQIVSLLAREKEANANAVLLDLIAHLEEMEEVAELRMPVKDGSLETTQEVFDLCTSVIERRCSRRNSEWILDEENLEGIRVRLGNGQFFMLRKSLHDPLVSLQIEAESKAEARRLITDPLVHAFSSHPSIFDALDTSVLDTYGN
jgi:phosphomannomutase